MMFLEIEALTKGVLLLLFRGERLLLMWSEIEEDYKVRLKRYTRTERETRN